MSSFDQEYFLPLYAVEDRHFWFRSRNRAVACLLDQILPSGGDGSRLLEVGCGTGNMLRMLRQSAPQGFVVGLDLYFQGLVLAGQRTDAGRVQADLQRLPFGVPFHLVGMFDVLEHLEDDRQVLAVVRDALAEDGYLLLTVPAHPSLWSYFDEVSHHVRRYREAELKEKLIQAGFRVSYLSPYLGVTYPLVWLRHVSGVWRSRQLEQNTKTPESMLEQEVRITPIVNEVVDWLLKFELASIRRRRRMHLGASLIAVAQKG